MKRLAEGELSETETFEDFTKLDFLENEAETQTCLFNCKRRWLD
jgi:hypothetical protein